MNGSLPTAKELEKLPLRAVVAYAARNARRVSAEFRGIVADDILDDALRLIDTVATTHLIGEIDQGSVIRASERVVAAYEAAPAGMQSGQKDLLVFSLVQAALTATSVIRAALDPTNARHERKRAARQAELAVNPIRYLSTGAANAATKAARRDYDILQQRCGEHDEVVIGDPGDCFTEPATEPGDSSS
jgi:hypothetical protein